MELITAFSEHYINDFIKKTLAGTDITVLSAAEAGLSFALGETGATAADNSEINTEVLWNMTQDAGKLCYVASEATPAFWESGIRDLTLMLPDGEKHHFAASGNKASHEIALQMAEFLKGNPGIGTQAAQKQEKVYQKAKKRRKKRLSESFPLWGILSLLLGLFLLYSAYAGQKVYREYLELSHRFSVTAEIVKVVDAKTGVETDMETYRRSDAKYKVYREYLVDGCVYSTMAKEKYPFAIEEHYFYRNEAGNAVEAEFPAKGKQILYLVLGIVFVIVFITDLIRCIRQER